MWRVENRRLEDAKSRSGESKIELWKVSAAFGAAGQSLDYPEGVGGRLGSVLGPSWGRLECVLRGLEVVLGTSWVISDASEAIPGRLGGRQHEAWHLSCRFFNDFQWISRPTIIEKSMKFAPKVIEIIVL